MVPVVALCQQTTIALIGLRKSPSFSSVSDRRSPVRKKKKSVFWKPWCPEIAACYLLVRKTSGRFDRQQEEAGKYEQHSEELVGCRAFAKNRDPGKQRDDAPTGADGRREPRR